MTSIEGGQPELSADGAPAVSESTVTRKLEFSDVHSIFECLHHGKQPPRHLPFSIVPVGPGDLKWSPPSYEFPGTVQTNYGRGAGAAYFLAWIAHLLTFLFSPSCFPPSWTVRFPSPPFSQRTDPSAASGFRSYCIL